MPAGLTDIVAIAAGNQHSLALKSDGTVVAWGYDYYGESTVPAGLTNVVAIAAGGSHSLALKRDGTVVAWGGNTAGQSTVPADLTNVVAIAGGDYYSLALVAASGHSLAPLLQARTTGKEILLAWPMSARNYNLQATTNLTDPNSWATLTNVPAMVDLQNTVTNPISGGGKFYRLKR